MTISPAALCCLVAWTMTPPTRFALETPHCFFARCIVLVLTAALLTSVTTLWLDHRLH